MRTFLLPACLVSLLLAGCGTALFMSHEERVAKSRADSTTIISNDTLFHVGRAMCLARVPESVTLPMVLRTFGGKELFSITAGYPVADGKYTYNVIFNSVGSHFEMTYASSERMDVIDNFYRRGILTRDSVGVAKLNKLLTASGAPTVEQQRRSDSIAAERIARNPPPPMTPPSSGGRASGGRTKPPEPKSGWARVHNPGSNTVWISVASEAGSGTEYINCSSNSWGTSVSWGKRVCVLDEDRNPVACAAVGEGASTVEISADGRSVSVH